jgi:hypothetical protein
MLAPAPSPFAVTCPSSRHNELVANEFGLRAFTGVADTNAETREYLENQRAVLFGNAADHSG